MHVVGGGVGMLGPLPVRAGEEDDRLQHRRLHALSATGYLARPEGAADAERGEVGGGHAGRGRSREDGAVVAGADADLVGPLDVTCRSVPTQDVVHGAAVPAAGLPLQAGAGGDEGVIAGPAAVLCVAP